MAIDARMQRASLVVILSSACLIAPQCDDMTFHSPDAGSSDSGPAKPVGTGGCGGEAASGGYTKAGTTWDGTAGNPYGYPQDQTPPDDCAGFGFHSTVDCAFYESCGNACTSEAQCPTVSPGPAPSCKQSNTGGGMCVLPCTDSTQCPTGMDCVNHPYGFGQICLWPKHYGK